MPVNTEQPSIQNAVQINESPVIKIERPVLTSTALNSLIDHNDRQSNHTISTICQSLVRTTTNLLIPDWLTSVTCHHKTEDGKNFQKQCSKFTKGFGSWILTFFPVVAILRKYELKTWLYNDVIAGLTVGIMHVPQGMAYAMLATLPPIYGLYTSFFPPLIYFFFGTSRHVSIGTIAVISLLTGEYLDKKVKSLLPQKQNVDIIITGLNTTESSTVEEDSQETAVRIQYAPALALTVGITQVAMGLLRMGGVTRYISGPMTSGFTVGVAVHVFTSQVKTLLGARPRKQVGVFAVPRFYYELFKAIRTSNPITIGLSAACILVLFVIKIWINPRVTRKIKVPIPIDLIIVILATVTSHYLDLNGKHGVNIVGHVSKGIPPPMVPSLENMEDSVSDVIVLAIVSFSVSISLTRIFAKTFSYRVDSNQELFAYGLSNTIGSFFQAFPSAASLSRSAVQVSAGGKTQVATVFSSILLILVLYFIGPLFYAVPNCCLSAIIVVALKGMFIHALEVEHLWKYSLWDCSTWLLTCLCTIVLDVKYGLLVGVVYSAMTIILRTQSPSIRILGKAANTEFYRDVQDNQKCTESSAIKVIRYEGSIYYACAENFRATIYEKSGMDPISTLTKMQKIRRRMDKIELLLALCSPHDAIATQQTSEVEHYSAIDSNGNNVLIRTGIAAPSSFTCSAQKDNSALSSGENMSTHHLRLRSRYAAFSKQLQTLTEKCALQYVILDCSCWNFIDFVGADELRQLVADYKKLSVSVLLAALADHLVPSLVKNGKICQEEVKIFPSIYDAVSSANEHLKDNVSRLNHIHRSIECPVGVTDLLLDAVEIEAEEENTIYPEASIVHTSNYRSSRSRANSVQSSKL
ncbi:Solute carrier family 26 prestin [Paragonimus heterotremus]|uniref:Solute carrier family 26 prestin n=1 Tax=Paragonimus heterotremus TaxID=100268 RepID=A0A8J4T6H3_9TREM|nr:Solute carrier family 26 prestin [Paragonimus heterotremus]